MICKKYFSIILANFEDVASKFRNLRRIHIGQWNLIELLTLINRVLLDLEKIKVDCFYTGLHFDRNIIDLFALNNIRVQLKQAEKVTIYIRERAYLSTESAINVYRLKSYYNMSDWITQTQAFNLLLLL